MNDRLLLSAAVRYKTAVGALSPSRRLGRYERHYASGAGQIPSKVWRSSRKFLRYGDKVEAMRFLEGEFTDQVLLGVVMLAQTDRPAVGRLERDPAIGTRAHVRTFDRELFAAGHRAMMPPDPGPMRRAGAPVLCVPRFDNALRHEPSHGRLPPV
jgi:hypothetical protein